MLRSKYKALPKGAVFQSETKKVLDSKTTKVKRHRSYDQYCALSDSVNDTRMREFIGNFWEKVKIDCQFDPPTENDFCEQGERGIITLKTGRNTEKKWCSYSSVVFAFMRHNARPESQYSDDPSILSRPSFSQHIWYIDFFCFVSLVRPLF